MDTFSLEEARELLMAQDVLPMSQQEVVDRAHEPESEDEALLVARAQDDEAFEAVLDAAFGTEEDVPENANDEQAEALRALDADSVGLGVDIVEIERMANILSRRSDFASKVFSADERAYCDSRSNPAAHYAVRFAAKEAVVKALGTGFSEGIGVRDIEVQRARNGRPSVVLTGAAANIAERMGVLDMALSMSYTKTDAVACALAMTKAAAVATEKRKDPMEELTRQFKETRKMLDEL